MKKKLFKLLLGLTLMLSVLLCLSVTASADFSGNYYVGQDVGTVQVFSNQSGIDSFQITAGALPEGVYLSWNDNVISMSGAPRAYGNFSVGVDVLANDGSYKFYINLSVAPQQTLPTPGVPAPTATPNPYAPPYITKHPTGETVEVGGSAKFIARADNASKIIWRLVSEDTNTTYNCADAPDYFPGLSVDGLGTECLILSGITSGMNKWCVEAKFEGPGGVEYSNGARLTVVQKATPSPKPQAPAGNNGGTSNPTKPTNPTNPTNPATAPTQPDLNIPGSAASAGGDATTSRPANISVQPMGKRIDEGESYTLNVIASSPNNGQLSYQWYSCPVNDRAAAIPIDGARESSYTPPVTNGTMYYCVAVINTREGVTSEPVYSDLVEVAVGPEPTPEPTPAPTKEPAAARDRYDRGSNTQLIFFGAIGFLALAALVGVLVFLRIEAKKGRDD